MGVRVWGVHAQSSKGIPSSGSKKYYGGDGAAYNEMVVGVGPGG